MKNGVATAVTHAKPDRSIRRRRASFEKNPCLNLFTMARR